MLQLNFQVCNMFLKGILVSFFFSFTICLFCLAYRHCGFVVTDCRHKNLRLGLKVSFMRLYFATYYYFTTQTRVNSEGKVLLYMWDSINVVIVLHIVCK